LADENDLVAMDNKEIGEIAVKTLRVHWFILTMKRR